MSGLGWHRNDESRMVAMAILHLCLFVEISGKRLLTALQPRLIPAVHVYTERPNLGTTAEFRNDLHEFLDLLDARHGFQFFSREILQNVTLVVTYERAYELY